MLFLFKFLVEDLTTGGALPFSGVFKDATTAKDDVLVEFLVILLFCHAGHTVHYFIYRSPTLRTFPRFPEILIFLHKQIVLSYS